MRFRLKDKELQLLWETGHHSGFLLKAVVKQFFEAILEINAARDVRSLYIAKSLLFEKRKGERKNQHSLRLTRKRRLVVELEEGEGTTAVKIIGIEDYH